MNNLNLDPNNNPWSEEYILSQIKDKFLYKRVTHWDRKEGYILLEDGAKVKVYCSDHDCCAWASGDFSDVKLDAVITDVDYKVTLDSKWDNNFNSRTSEATLTLFHNQNIITQNLIYADAGEGGAYYSVASLVIGDFEIPVLMS